MATKKDRVKVNKICSLYGDKPTMRVEVEKCNRNHSKKIVAKK